jgi:uncharacterized protein YjiS (DUF1127 family)
MKNFNEWLLERTERDQLKDLGLDPSKMSRHRMDLMHDDDLDNQFPPDWGSLLRRLTDDLMHHYGLERQDAHNIAQKFAKRKELASLQKKLDRQKYIDHLYGKRSSVATFTPEDVDDDDEYFSKWQ